MFLAFGEVVLLAALRPRCPYFAEPTTPLLPAQQLVRLPQEELLLQCHWAHDCGGAGHNPACCIAEDISNTRHTSVIFPFLKRKIVFPGTVIIHPLAGNPIPSCVFVPHADQNTTTRSSSATICLTLTCMSGSAFRSSFAAAMSSASVAS